MDSKIVKRKRGEDNRYKWGINNGGEYDDNSKKVKKSLTNNLQMYITKSQFYSKKFPLLFGSRVWRNTAKKKKNNINVCVLIGGFHHKSLFHELVRTE